jgi:hypothetical protein
MVTKDSLTGWRGMMGTPDPEQLIDPYFFKVAAVIKTATPEQLARPHA